MRPARGDLIAGSVLLAVWLACFGRLVAHPGSLIVDGHRPSIDFAQRDDVRVVGNDLTFLFLPHYANVAERWARTGRLPQWDSFGFCGRPMVGNPQGGLFYPPVWLACLSGAPAALGWLTAGHLLWAGLGTYLLLRGMGAGRVAATIAAGCFEASPYLLAHTFEGHYPHVWSACWYPWAFWAAWHSRQRRAMGTLALPPLLALTFLTGHPQEGYYLLFALTVWRVADAAQHARRQGLGAAGLTLVVWAGVVGLTLGMMAVEIFPILGAQPWTLRAARYALSRVAHYQLHGLSVFQLLDPVALGGPADYFGPDNYWETVLSIGLVPLVLGLFAVAGHPRRGLVHGWTLLVIAAVVFAAGRRLGLFSVLFGLVPGMNRFRVPGRTLFLAALGASVLAGLGAEALAAVRATDWWERGFRAFRRGAIVTVAGLAALVPFTFGQSPVTFSPPKGPIALKEARRALRRPEPKVYRGTLAAARILQNPMFWIGLGGSLGIFVLGRRREARRPALAAALGALALVELAVDGHALLKVAPAVQFLGPDPISTALSANAPAFSDPFRIRGRDTLYGDLRAFSHGFDKVNINDSFQIQHAADLYQTLYPLLYLPPTPDPDEPMSAPVAQFHREVAQGVLDRLGVAFLVSDHVETDTAWPLLTTGTWDGSAFAIHANPRATPRAYVVPRAEAAPDQVTGILARFRNSDPHAAVLMRTDPLGPGGTRQPFTPAKWLSTDPDHVAVRVATQAPGLLVIADTWMPGWTARVDGRTAPIYRGNHAQRVVPLREAGTHEIEMSYKAPGLALGVRVTALSGMIWVTAGLVLVGAGRRPSAIQTSDPGPHTLRRTACAARPAT